MKSLLLTATFFLIPFFGFSQEYKLDQLKNYYWNGTTAAWEQEETRFYSYANGGIKETNILAIDFLSSENYYQINKSYNTYNDISLTVNQEWDASLMDWSTYSEVVYAYDASNKLISETTRIYDNSTMTYINEARVLYNYSGSLITLKTYQEWISNTNSWRDDYKIELSYTDDLLTEQISSYWSALNTQWYLEDKNILLYNTNNQLIEWRYESYSYFDTAWELQDRTLITYTGMLQTELLNQNWNGTNWINDVRQLNTYDANDNKTTFIQEDWSATLSQWVPQYKEEMEYSLAAPLLVNDFAIADYKLYPNPSNGQFTINLGAEFTNVLVEIYNTLGQRVSSSHYTATDKVEQHIATQAGIYFAKINTDVGTSKTIRIIKQ